jgi:hypothetical protein
MPIEHSSDDSEHPHPASQARASADDGGEPLDRKAAKELAFKATRSFARADHATGARLLAPVTDLITEGIPVALIARGLTAWQEAGEDDPAALREYVEALR